jgi:hypothetical protein
MRQALFDYLACDRVAAVWARKRPANFIERGSTTRTSP